MNPHEIVVLFEDERTVVGIEVFELPAAAPGEFRDRIRVIPLQGTPAWEMLSNTCSALADGWTRGVREPEFYELRELNALRLSGRQGTTEQKLRWARLTSEGTHT